MTKAYSYAVEVKVLVAKTGEVILGNCRHATAPESGWAEEIAGDNSWATALKMLDLHSGYCSVRPLLEIQSPVCGVFFLLVLLISGEHEGGRR